MTSHLNTVLPGATCSLLRSFRSSSHSRVSGGHVHAHLFNGRCQIIVAIRRLFHFVQIQAHASEHATTHHAHSKPCTCLHHRYKRCLCMSRLSRRARYSLLSLFRALALSVMRPSPEPGMHNRSNGRKPSTCQWPAGRYTNRFTRIFPLGLSGC